MKTLLLPAFAILLLLTAINGHAQDAKTKSKSDKTQGKGMDKNADMDMNKNKNMNNSQNQAASMSSDRQSAGDLPYTATYSSQFEIGNPQNARLVLELWKDWDNNMLDNHADRFADTITMILPDGHIVKGKDAVLSGGKQERGNYTTVKSNVDAFVPLHSTDRDENWVAIWGSEEDTKADGTRQTTYHQEIWRINKDGKIDFMQSFIGKEPMNQ